LREYAILVLLFVLLGILSVAADHFLTWINVVNTLESGSIYGLVAIALTILLILGEFDLSAGATCVLAGIVAAKLQPVIGTWPSLGLGALSGAVVGIFNGLIVTAFRVNSFIVTLAVALVVVGLGTIITDGFQLYISDPGFGSLGNGKFAGVGYLVLVFFAFAAFGGLVLSRAKIGRWIYATGDNPEAARLVGIDTAALRLGAFAFSGLAAGVAGAILVSRTGTAIAGDGFGAILFPAIAAVVVGGTSIAGGRGAVWRTIVGILFLELIRNGFNLLEVNPYYQGISQGVIILAAVIADALGRRRR
jgi:ribose transport system permease protein